MSQFWFHGQLLWTLSNLVLEISKDENYTASLAILFQCLHSCSCWQDDRCVILIHIFLLINLILQFCPIGHSWAQKRKTNFCEIDTEKISSKRHHYSAILHISFILLSLSLGHLLSLLSFLIYLAIFFYLFLITGNWFHPSLPQPTVLCLMHIKLLCTLFSVDAM